MAEEPIKANLMYKNLATLELTRQPVTFLNTKEISEFMEDLAQATVKDKPEIYVTINDHFKKIKIIDFAEDGTRYDLIRLVGVWRQ